MRGLAFQGDDTLTVTRRPIETYVDYQGTCELSARCEHDPHHLSAYEPPDFDREGG